MQASPKRAAPGVADIDRIAAISDAAVRNCEITQAYCELAEAVSARQGGGLNWLHVATWASRQAGDTIRAEHVRITLRRRLGVPAVVSRPFESLWRALLRAGLLNPETLLGRVVRAIPGPLDAIEAASENVARGNLEVFEEIGRAYAAYLEADSAEAFTARLREGDPPEGQEYLRRAFARMQSGDAQQIFLANLEIAWQEQVRLQPVIRASFDQPVVKAYETGLRALAVVAPGYAGWWAGVRKAAALTLGGVLAPVSRFGLAVARHIVTERLMTLRLPDGSIVRLGETCAMPPSPELAAVTDPELRDMLARVGCRSAEDDCGTDDWSDLRQRLHYIAHLFRAVHGRRELFGASPFTPEQLAVIRSGRLPEGSL